MDCIIDAIVIDTSVLINYQFDFLGWTSKILPALYDLLEEKNINLLNNFILDNEIKKHIPESAIIARTEGLEQSFKRNKDFLKLIGISAEDAIDKLKSLDLKQWAVTQEENWCTSEAAMRLISAIHTSHFRL